MPSLWLSFRLQSHVADTHVLNSRLPAPPKTAELYANSESLDRTRLVHRGLRIGRGCGEERIAEGKTSCGIVKEGEEIGMEDTHGPVGISVLNHARDVDLTGTLSKSAAIQHSGSGAAFVP